MPLLSGAHICTDHLLRMMGSRKVYAFRRLRCMGDSFHPGAGHGSLRSGQALQLNAFTVAQLGFLLSSSAAQFDFSQTLTLHGTAQHLRLQGITSATSRRTAVSWAAGTVDKEYRLSKHSKVDHASNHLQFALRSDTDCGCPPQHQSAIVLHTSAASQKTLTTVLLTSFLSDQSRH